MDKIAAIIPAAGRGRRMGANKQLLLLGQKPVLAHTLELFQASPIIQEIIVAASVDDINFIKSEIVEKYKLSKVTKIIPGGEERQDSVRLGLEAVDKEINWVVVHDGARPLLLLKELEDIISKAVETGAAILAVPVKDTIKLVSSDGEVISTPDRASLWSVQTPQVFRKDILQAAHSHAMENEIFGTDEASLVEALGLKVYIVRGSYENIKLTTPEDILLAVNILNKRGLVP